MTADPPLLSIVVACYTMERLADLGELLDSIAGQTYRPLQTVIVVEQSAELRDRLQQELAHRPEIAPEIHFNPGRVGLSYNRNVGVQHARGAIIAFVDDDVVLSPTWAERVVALFADPTVMGMTGPALPRWHDPSMRWLPEEYHWLISCTSWVKGDDIRPVRNVWGHNMAFRRAAFAQAGLFHTDVGLIGGVGGPVAEDNEFSLRVQARTGGRLLLDPRAVVWHQVHPYRLSWRYVAQRSFWIGRSRHLMRRLPGAPGPALAPETQLLRQIALRLPPRIGRTLLRRPAIAFKQVRLAAWSLACVGAGYLTGFVQRPATRSAAGA
jgi:glycosyltransferase involved in cell wall biosynthesis